MKAILTLVLLMCLQSIIAQQVLIPYRVGNKYGLSDEKGKLLLQPQYDAIEYLNETYFKYINHLVTKDTMRNSYGDTKIREREAIATGVLNKTKLIINNQPYKHYFIYKHCIVGSQNPYHPENCALYNLKGEKILPEVKGLGINDTRDIGKFATATDKLTLIAIFERNERRDRIFSLAVYDNVQQKITSYLLTKVFDFVADKNFATDNDLLYKYRDEQGIQEKFLRYANNKFELVDKIVLYKNESAKGVYPGKGSMGDYDYSGSRDMGVPAMESVPSAPLSEDEKERLGYYYYFIKNDTLSYGTSTNRQMVQLPKDTRIIYSYPKSNSQREPVIYKHNNKFGLIVKGQSNAAQYDSLLYFGSNYIAYKQIDNTIKCGVVNRDGKELIPFVYDSIEGPMKKFRFEDINTNNKRTFYVVLQNVETEYGTNKKAPFVKLATNKILVYQNGKSGLVSDSNTMILPVEYDLIAQNGMNFQQPFKSDFILLKKNGLYGMANIQYNKLLKKNVVNTTIQPMFTHIPCCYQDNYYNKKGFTLYSLYDDAHNFMGYANERGFLYYSN